MAESIDALELELSADAQGADESIEKLASSLLKLQDSLGNVNLSVFRNLSDSMKDFASAAREASNALKSFDFSKMVKGDTFQRFIDSTAKSMIRGAPSRETTRLYNEARQAAMRYFEALEKYRNTPKPKTDDGAGFVGEGFDMSGVDLGDSDPFTKNLNADEAFDYEKALRGVNDAFNEMANVMLKVSEAGSKMVPTEQAKKLREIVSGFKHVKFESKASDLGANYKQFRAILGKGYSASKGAAPDGFLGITPKSTTIFADVVDDINGELGNIIEKTMTEADQLERLVQLLKEVEPVGDNFYNGSKTDEELQTLEDYFNERTQPFADSIKQYQETFGDLTKNVGFSEPTELEKMLTAINDVTNAVRKKNQAFEDEGKVVSTTVAGELSQLDRLSRKAQETQATFETRAGKMKMPDWTDMQVGFSGLPGLEQVRQIGESLAALSTIQYDAAGLQNLANAVANFGRKTVTQAASNLPILTSALEGLGKSLSGISFEGFAFDGLEQLVSAISKLGGKSASKAAEGNIAALATALKNMMVTLSSAPTVSHNVIEMAQSLAQLASTGGKAGTAAKSLTSGFNSLPASTNKAKTGFKGLASAIGKFYATYWMLIRSLGTFKKAIDFSSDLTEVQNVVDVSFGDMADKMNDFASTALKTYGMSELTAKRLGSQFQAMGTSIGFSQEKMSDMSVRLTQLAGDIASFYNIGYEEAGKKLEGIFTGQTKPLRALGIDLSFATVEAWALSKGINADMEKMTQAEKTMLRYQFVLDRTSQTTGDFQRTISTWANQLRLLAGNFEQLGSVVGGTLINAFKPFIMALNSVMGAVINFAKVVSDALGKIFGWEYQVGGGVANDMEFGADAAEDMDDSLGGAADNAKKLNRYIAAWHEVNNMTTNDSGKGGGGSGGGGGAGDVGDADGGQWVQKPAMWEKYKSDIDSLYELGSYISKVLSDAMNRIDWDSIYEKARNFGAGLASFLNGLIKPDLFGAIGTTIAGALNTVLHGLDSFGVTFDWINFGNSIATGINNFFSTFNFELLAHTINTWAHGMLDSLITALDNINWEQIGEKIGTFLADIDFTGILGKVGKAIWKALNGAFKAFSTSFDIAPLETALLGLIIVGKKINTKGFKDLAKSLKTLSTNGKLVVGAFKGVPESIDALSKKFPKLGKAVDVARDSFKLFKTNALSGNAFGGLKSALDNVRNNLTGMGKLAGTAASGFAEFNMVSDSINDLATGEGNVLANLLELGGGAAIGAAGMYTALGTKGLAMAAVTGLVAAIKGINDAFEEVNAERLGNAISDAFNNPGGTPFSEVVSQFSDSMGAIGESFDGLSEHTATIDSANGSIKNTWLEIERIQTAMDNGVISVEEGTTQLKSLFGDLATVAAEKFGALDQSLIQMFGENGVLRGAMDAAGVDAGELVADTLQLSKDVQDRVIELNKLLSETDPSNPQYAVYLEELQTLLGGTDEAKLSLENFDRTISGMEVDYSGIVGDGGQLDSTQLQTFLDGIVGAVSGTQEKLGEAKDNATKTLTEYRDVAIQRGDETAEGLNKTLDALPAYIEGLQGELGGKGQLLTDALQNEVIGNITGVIEQAQTDWDNMKWWEKLFVWHGDEVKYLQSAAGDYKTNFIDPLAEQIETSFDQIGVDGAGWASNAADEIIKGMFTVDHKGSVAETQTKLNANWKEIIENNKKETVPIAENSGKEIADSQADSTVKEVNARSGDVSDALTTSTSTAVKASEDVLTDASKDTTPKAVHGWTDSMDKTFKDDMKIQGSTSGVFEDNTKAMVDGGNKGIEDNIDTSEKPMKSWTDKLIDLFKGFLGINSPSTVFADFGKNTVEGFNGGIESNQSLSESPIRTWVNSITGWFTDLLGINSPSTVFNGYGKNTVEGFNSGISDNQSESHGVISTWVSKIKGWFTDKVDGLGIESPSKLFAQYGAYTVEGFNDGIEDEEQSTYRTLTSWVSGISDIFEGYSPNYDLLSDVKLDKIKVDAASVDSKGLVAKAQAAMELAMRDDGFIDYDKLAQAMYEANSQVAKENPLKVGDDAVFSATKRAQSREYKRTGKIGWAGI